MGNRLENLAIFFFGGSAGAFLIHYPLLGVAFGSVAVVASMMPIRLPWWKFSYFMLGAVVAAIAVVLHAVWS